MKKLTYNKPYSIKLSIIGFILSLFFTALAFLLVANDFFQPKITLYIIIGSAILQIITQVICFLHFTHVIGKEWDIIAFVFTLLIIVIIVFGSLWIMNHLNVHMMIDHK